MRIKVQKWGNSLALKIPPPFVHEMGIQEGSRMEVSVSTSYLVATPAHLQKLKLKDLLAGITRANLHPEVDF